MSWEKRGKYVYYYSTRRVDGRVVRTYHGRKPAAHVLAATVAHRKASLQAEQDGCRRAQAELQPLLDAGDRVHREGRELFRTAMEESGFHRQNYSVWRRKRMTAQSNKASTRSPSQRPTKPAPGTIADAFQRARRGDHKAMPIVRKVFDKHPVEWKKYADLAARVSSLLITQMTGNDLVQRESFVRQVEELRAGLLGSASSPLERLLVDRIVVGWLNVHLLEFAIASPTTNSTKFADHLLKRQQMADRQYTRAIRELQIVRRLAPGVAAETPRSLPTEPSYVESASDWTLRLMVEEQQTDEEPSPDRAPTPVRKTSKASAQQAPIKPAAAAPAKPTSQQNPAVTPAANDLEDVPVIGARLEPAKPQWMLDIEREFERESA